MFTNFRIFVQMKVGILVSTLALNQRETKRGTGKVVIILPLFWVLSSEYEEEPIERATGTERAECIR
jgi:hypothetical protein